MSGKWTKLLPFVFMALVALSRWPGLFGKNFSACYALMFCAGAFFPRNIKWWLPLTTLILTDVALNLFYYHSWSTMQLVNYVAYLAIIAFGTWFNPRGSFLGLLSGGVAGAVLFYFITNTAAWLFNPFQNPEYIKDLTGWLIALTKGTAGYPPTIEFFINSLLSGGLFTGLFVGAMKLSDAAAESAKEKETEDEDEKEPEGEAEPGEAKA